MTSIRVLYRADGSPDIGTGHIVRGLILRQHLTAAGAVVHFVSRDLPWGLSKLRSAGCEVTALPADATPEAECAALRQAITALHPQVCVFDVLETAGALTAVARAAGARVVCVDDIGPGRLNAAAIINILEVEPAPEALATRGIALHQGPQYAALADDYAQPGIAEREIPRAARRLIVTVGGADPARLAPKATRALKKAFASPKAESAFDDPHVTLVVGSASGYRREVARAMRGMEARFSVVDSVPSLLPLLRDADLGVVAGGLTMHEALAAGLPALALCQDVRHQAELAQRFAGMGAIVTLGRGAEVSEARIAAAILELAGDEDLRRRLACCGSQVVDGQGAARTAQVILDLARGDRPAPA